MIRFTLQCPEGHRFESWFRDGRAFEALAAAGELSCPSCGSHDIAKSLMTPQVRPARDAGEAPGPLAPLSEHERALAALRARIEAEADYVGISFVREARAMHEGRRPTRPIYGEVKPAEAIELIEEGIPVAPLPFAPKRKLN